MTHFCTVLSILTCPTLPTTTENNRRQRIITDLEYPPEQSPQCCVLCQNWIGILCVFYGEHRCLIFIQDIGAVCDRVKCEESDRGLGSRETKISGFWDWDGILGLITIKAVTHPHPQFFLCAEAKTEREQSSSSSFLIFLCRRLNILPLSPSPLHRYPRQVPTRGERLQPSVAGAGSGT